MVSILFLLVLGSVMKRFERTKKETRSLNPILAGTGFCHIIKLNLVYLLILSHSYSCWYWVLSSNSSRVRKVRSGVSILFFLVLGSVTGSEAYRSQKPRSQSYSCWYWVLSSIIKQKIFQYESQSYSCWYWVLSPKIYNFIIFKELDAVK